MAEFCRLLFGLDKATPEQTQAGVAAAIGHQTIARKTCMNWELQFLRCEKSAGRAC